MKKKEPEKIYCVIPSLDIIPMENIKDSSDIVYVGTKNDCEEFVNKNLNNS